MYFAFSTRVSIIGVDMVCGLNGGMIDGGENAMWMYHITKRIKAAIKNSASKPASSHEFPNRSLTINRLSADLFAEKQSLLLAAFITVLYPSFYVFFYLLQGRKMDGGEMLAAVLKKIKIEM